MFGVVCSRLHCDLVSYCQAIHTASLRTGNNRRCQVAFCFFFRALRFRVAVSFKGLCRALPAPRIPVRELACFSLHPHADMVVIVFQSGFYFPIFQKPPIDVTGMTTSKNFGNYLSGVTETAFGPVIGVPELIAGEAQPSFAFFARCRIFIRPQALTGCEIKLVSQDESWRGGIVSSFHRSGYCRRALLSAR